MNAKVIPINSPTVEIEAFKKVVRPGYAETCASLWNALCAPVLNLMDAYSRWTTQRFVDQFDK